MIYVKCAKESYMIPFADAPDVFNAKAGKKGFVILFLICGGAAIIGCRLFDRRYTR